MGHSSERTTLIYLTKIENSLVILELRIKAFEIAWGVDGEFFNIFVVIANVLALIGRWTVIMPSSLNSVYAHPHCRYINLQWRMFGLDENYTSDLRTVTVTTAINFKENLYFAIATPASDLEANLISVVKSTSTELNNIIVNIKGVVTGGSNGQIRVFFVGK